jgi:hypothetical protein
MSGFSRDTESGVATTVALLVALGVLLLAHPLYLDSLIRRSGGGFGIYFLYDVVFAAVGMLSLLSGLRITSVSPVDRVHRLGPLVIAILATLSLPLGEAILAPFVDVLDVWVAGVGTRELFLASWAGLWFTTLAGVARRDWLLTVAGLAYPIPFFVLLLTNEYVAPLGPVLDLVLVSLNDEILGIPGVGAVLFLVAGLIGWTVGESFDDGHD